MALTAKQEAFCQAYIGKAKRNKSEAYRIAYSAENMSPEAITNEAYILGKNPDVALMIMELEEKVAERAIITAESINAELEEARVMAIDMVNPNAAVSASMGKAKVCGLLVDRVAEVEDVKPLEINFATVDANKNA